MPRPRRVHAVRRTRSAEGRSFNYELFNCSNFNIRYWSWNYRGCWHQNLPSSCSSLRVLDCTHSNYKTLSRALGISYFLSLPPRVGIGQFSRLLPSLDVVAVSQAPSPESNPNSPFTCHARRGGRAVACTERIEPNEAHRFACVRAAPGGSSPPIRP